MMVCNAPIVAPSTALPLPPGFDEVCLRALERDPEKRFPTARAFAEALSKVVSDADWEITPHEVAEHVSTAFAEDLSRRKALIRDRGRVVVEPVKEPSGNRRAPTLDSVAHDATVAQAAPPKETSASIPAIEVASARRPAENTTMRLSTEPAAPRSRRPLVVAGAAAIACLVVGAWALTRPAAPVSPPAVAASLGRPATAPTPAPAVAAPTPAPVAPPAPVAAPTPAPVIAAPAADASVAAPAAVGDTLAARTPTGRRRRGDAGAAVTAPNAPEPAAPSGPALEANPYLRH